MPEQPSPSTPAAASSPRRPRSEGVNLIITIVIALGLVFIIQSLIVKPFSIPSGSMEPTLDIGDRIIADRATLRFREPRLGEIIVFHPPAAAMSNECDDATPEQACTQTADKEADLYYIKRVVGVGGDRLRFEGGRVIRNGKRLTEPWARLDTECEVCELPEEITVPKGSFYMVGDNRGNSADSRYWGAVPRDSVVGIARARYWPVNGIGGL